ncbi:PREDICTED: exosome complex component RRP40 [Ceratosolen solmsi marchali]|uniref:Exosome complex component RRP40 n=1 Tax=Ceratosolen solmsi marchali TaxID=326594 RepID=A0AAJ6YM30_9HYME|nr:PREDICTED: exosome complex component RRP40 [Ceratosolen solmsi marchali]
MEAKAEKIVMPGDIIKDTQLLNKKQKIILGPGLRTDGETVYACKAGILKHRSNVFYVDNFQKRYIPSQGENVVGIVTQKAGDIYKVDIGASEQASLSYLAFEGSSKKNRPNIQIGDIVYAKLLVASKDMEPEIVCVDSFGKKGKLGVLSTNGMLFTCSLSLVRKILKPNCPLLRLLSDELKYELAVGINGKIWIKSKTSVEDTIAVANAILAAEYTVPSEFPQLCDSIMKSLVKLK